MAADVAAQLANGLLSNLYEQIDPLRLAEYDRANRIAEHYGNRIKTNNVKPDSIKRLLEKYPSHEYCIDSLEAKELFTELEQPNKELDELGNYLKAFAEQCLNKEETAVFYLIQPPPKPETKTEPKKDEPTTKSDIISDATVKSGGNGEGKGNPEAAPTARSETAKLAAASQSRT
jgi:hypothetical protein